MIIAFQELSAKLKVISLLNTPVISGREISTETAKMQLVKKLVVILSILRLNYAAVKSCIKENEENKICFKSMDGTNTSYVDPYPLVLKTKIVLKEIIDIDEKERSITIRAYLVTSWKDPRIGLSNGTTRYILIFIYFFKTLSKAI